MVFDNKRSTPLGVVLERGAVMSVLIPPVVATVLLYVVAAALSADAGQPYAVLAALVFSITLVVYREMWFHMSGAVARSALDFLQLSVTAWAIVIGCLAVLAFVLQYGEVFSRRVMLTWAVLAPLAIAAAQNWGYRYASRTQSRRKVVIAGASELSRRLAESIQHPAYGLELVGWFDDRGLQRTESFVAEHGVLGRLTDLPEYVKQNQIDVIYIALPIRHQERTKHLLDELHDTTASIYFVPDIFVFDLIQSRVDMIEGIPAVALCETPFYGLNGFVKRMTDLCIGTTALILASPVMLVVAIAVAVTTPGSVIFKQRRYGLDGREIIIYKFRTMTATDDGHE